MDLGLKGAKVLVTGSTKGIGRAIADTFAAEGADVGICARNKADVDSAVAAIKAKGVAAFGDAVDVSNGPALKAWVEDMASKLGGIDVVVANVSALSIGQDEESWEKEFSTDMMGTVRLVNAAMPYLEKSKAAAIVTISSVSGREVDFASGPYGTFKAAIIHYTQGLAFQLAGKGIRANSVSPGNTYFEGGVWNHDQGRQSRIVQDRAGAESRPAAWAHRRRWRTAPCSLPARRQASSPGPISSWTVPSRAGFSSRCQQIRFTTSRSSSFPDRSSAASFDPRT